jgi:hypothetical protein
MTRGCIAFPLPLIVSASLRKYVAFIVSENHASMRGAPPSSVAAATRARRLRKAQPRLGH